MLDPRHLPLIGDRTRLRALRHEDAAAYAAGTADPEVRRFAHLPEPEYTEESVVALVDGPVRDGLARGDLAVLAIADVATDRFAGSLVLFDVDDATAEVGFWVHADHRGRGFAVEALDLAGRLARLSGLRLLTARTAVDNLGAQRALETAGYRVRSRGRDVAPSGREVVAAHYVRGLV